MIVPAVIGFWLVILFHVYGVTVWEGDSGRSLFGWLYFMWSKESTEAVDYSHGLVIPFVSMWLLWRERAGILAVWRTRKPSGVGVVLLAFALLLHAAGLRAQVPHLSAIAFVLSLFGLICSAGGLRFVAETAFPVGFLLFAIPVSFLARATFPLRMVGSIAAAAVLNGIGIATTRVGTAVYSEVGQGFAMDVADACSGIRSIMALMALAAVYAYVIRKGWISRCFLFAMSLPIAVVANIGRIVTIGIVAAMFGQEIGMKVYHDYSSYLIFVLSVLMLIAVNALMEKVQKLKGVSSGGRAKERANEA
jgi:exosortase